jgi:DNA (cytosine-5)-methyltransferase 1
MRTVWLCEQNPFCRRVLARHWPGVPCHPDVRALVADTEGERQPSGAQVDEVGWPWRGQPLVGAEPRADGRAEPRPVAARGGGRKRDRVAAGEGDLREPVSVPVPPVDVLCGGFPCQDISLAGRGAGLAGERSGLWREFARLVGELRPRYVLVENVPALTSRGLDVVLADLAACGFDAEWDHLPASAFGAPHRRDRIWIVAYPAESGLEGHRPDAGRSQEPEFRNGRALANPSWDVRPERAPSGSVRERARASGERSRARVLADTEGQRRESRPRSSDTLGARQLAAVEPQGRSALPAGGVGRGAGGLAQSGLGVLAHGLPSGLGGHWDREPDISRVASGVPERVDRLRALGNALVPQIAEWIGERIIEWEAA